MTRLYVIKREDGSVAIASINNPEVTIEETLRKSHTPDLSPVVSHRATTIDKIPSDRSFRDAWTDDNPTDTVDIVLPKARDIHMTRIRQVRDRELTRLDLESIKNISRPKRLAKVEAEKQRLRDLPSTINLDSDTTPETLKRNWPIELPNHEVYT